MFSSVKEAIRSRSREEYGQLYVDLFNYYRELVQENGEIALVLGVGLGVAFVVFFKVCIVALVVLTVIMDAIYLIAEPEAVTAIPEELTDTSAVSRNGHHASEETVESHTP